MRTAVSRELGPTETVLVRPAGASVVTAASVTGAGATSAAGASVVVESAGGGSSARAGAASNVATSVSASNARNEAVTIECDCVLVMDVPFTAGGPLAPLHHARDFESRAPVAESLA